MSDIEITAQAVAEVAAERKILSNVIRDLRITEKILSESQNIVNELTNPRVSKATRIETLTQLLGKSVSQEGRDVLSLLIERSQLDNLDAFVRELQTIARDREATIFVRVESAVPLSAEQLKKLITIISGKTKKKVEIEEVVNEDLIGGLRVVVNEEKVIDQTVKRRLSDLGKFIVQ